MEKKHYPLVYFLIFIFILAGIGFFVRSKQLGQPITISKPPTTTFENSFFEKDKLVKFANDADFMAIMSTSQSNSSLSTSINNAGMMAKTEVAPQLSPSSSDTVARSSSTNVQVAGIDEPDIVKTDSSSIYYSKEGQYRYFMNTGTSPMGIEVQSAPSTKMMPPQYNQVNEIVAVGALPPSQMKMQSSIAQSGEMLISDKVLVVFANDPSTGALLLVGYSIANPSTPKKLWELPFSAKSQKITARLYKSSLYLVTSTTPMLPRPCPVPLLGGNMAINIRCTDIYMPSSRPSTDAVYTVLKINPQKGSVEKTMSFVGQSGQSTAYMSQDFLYLSYQVAGDSINILNQFISENQGIFPGYLEEKIKKLQGYDLSLSTKEIEMNSLISIYLNSMDNDERLKQENQLTNAFKQFFSKYKRSFEYTGIVKVKNDDLSIQATGKVPGVVLNQFSFDEWKGDLRVATTTGARNPFYMIGRGQSNQDQVSDVYVLGGDLEVKGSVKDLGKTERIYGVRFIEDRGYVVTYRQTDPFYVLDLSNGNSPQLKGELKIPGYSSYLHALDSHLILGIGRENQVKLSLFDVTDPTNPKEVSHYELAGEYWTEAMDNHHAFLQDKKYNAFFLPGGRGGYVFSYDANNLSLVKAIESPTVKRGLYLNDYLYIVSDSGITSFKEGSWDKMGEFFYQKNIIVDPTTVLPPTQIDPISPNMQNTVVTGTPSKPL